MTNQLIGEITPQSRQIGGAMQVVWCSICMVAVSGLQYAWTLFVLPMSEAQNWGRADIQFGYALFIGMQAWPLLVYGMLVDRYKPRVMMFAGGVLVAFAWSVNSYATSLTQLYVGEMIAGIGSGLVIAAAYGNTLKRFNMRRGLAVGVVSAGYGFGAAFTFLIAEHVISSLGYQAAFLWLGIGQGALIVTVSLIFLKNLPTTKQMEKKKTTRDASVAVRELWLVVKAPEFVLMYAMFALVAAGGVMVAAQLSPIAHDLRIADKSVTLIGITMSAILWAGMLDRIANGISRPFFGWVSDIIGREITLFIAFMLEGMAVMLLVKYAHDPVLFVLFSGLVLFAWGEIFSLFPSLCTDIFGEERATTNYGALYTAKGVASFFVPLSSILAVGGSWDVPFYLVVTFDLTAASLALVLLHLRMRKKGCLAQRAVM